MNKILSLAGAVAYAAGFVTALVLLRVSPKTYYKLKNHCKKSTT